MGHARLRQALAQGFLTVEEQALACRGREGGLRRVDGEASNGCGGVLEVWWLVASASRLQGPRG